MRPSTCYVCTANRDDMYHYILPDQMAVLGLILHLYIYIFFFFFFFKISIFGVAFNHI